MIHARLVRNDFHQALLNISRLATSSGRRMVQRGMALKFQQLTRANFGTSGLDRPVRWPALSPAYAKRKGGGSVATLIGEGALRDSVKLSGERERWSEVSSDSAYAFAHTFGVKKHNLPPRPFFPVQFVGKSYRLTANADRMIWIEAKRRIAVVTRNTIPYFTGQPWRRSTFETHSLTSPV